MIELLSKLCSSLELLKNCGSGGTGSPGFQPGNVCARGGGLISGGDRGPGSEYYNQGLLQHKESYDPSLGVPFEAHIFIQMWQWGVKGYEPDAPPIPSDAAIKQLQQFTPKEAVVLYRVESNPNTKKNHQDLRRGLVRKSLLTLWQSKT